ncbi:MAG: AAA family ATPase [Muribaculaceae bacterium]|nr:AAA family ATPase [Muribaculaceae bacterium]
MEETKVRYPIGQQDFKTLRERDLLYIDKTEYVRRIVDDGSHYFFLARPRRFGKSLFLSTLRYFFEGKRELFKGLYIDSSDWDWTPYPVVHIQLGQERYDKPGMLEKVLDKTFRELEKRYAISDVSRLYSMRLYDIIQTASKISGKRVVILIDDYDKPMIDNLNDKEAYDHCYNLLGGMYGNLKSNAEHIALAFVAGTYHTGQFEDLHELNHLYDISDSSTAAGICGFTEEEIHKYLSDGIKRFALSNGLFEKDEVFDVLRNRYMGYRFSTDPIDVYNPWSVLNALAYSEIKNFWNETGMPQVVKASLKSLDPSELMDLDDIRSSLSYYSCISHLDNDLVGLLYLNGYLTIKEYDMEYDRFLLGIPNKEVRYAIYDTVNSQT